jgi:hypothetical protein
VIAHNDDSMKTELSAVVGVHADGARTFISASDMTDRLASAATLGGERVCVSYAAPLGVRAWTGRSAVSAATTTARPHIATAGARGTRVSEMRLVGARIARVFHVGTPAHPVIAMSEPSLRTHHAMSG